MSIKELVNELTPLSHKQLIALAIAQSTQLNSAATTRDDMAIIGLHCVTPGADSPEGFWDTLMQHPNVFKDLREERFPSAGVQLDHYTLPQRAYSYTAGLIDSVDTFDPGFFGISPREARGMDPQQRLVLQSVVSALANAGYAWQALRQSHTGVFVGTAANEYGSFNDLLNSQEEASHAASGNALNVIAGRVAYVLGLRGPAIALDTACSSSLVALHMACESLHAGDCEQAIVSGVNIILSPATFMLLCQGQMLSPDGRCKTFDKNANGYVRAEAVATVIVKPLSRALEEGDRILACIKGSAVNQDGRSAGLTVPSSVAQKSVIEAALQHAKLSPEQIDYVECHGTGTALGDPIEVQALSEAYCNVERKPLILGAAKSCIGHAEAASGLVGLIKAVLALEKQCIPPQAQFKEWNPLIHIDPAKVRIPTVATPWTTTEGTPRRCAISAFGFSGTNAHVILQEHIPSSPAPVKSPLPPIQFDARRYWWAHPIDPLKAANAAKAMKSLPEHGSEVSATSLEEAVTMVIAKVAGVEAASMSADMSLSNQLGFDSIMIATLRDQLGNLLKHPEQQRISLQIFFGNDSVGEIVHALEAAGFQLQAPGSIILSPTIEQPSLLTTQVTDYFSERTALFDEKNPQRIARKLVHKTYDENVLVADISQLNEKEFLAEMTQDYCHAYYYEHYLDHVPGLYIVEAVRQAATALCHMYLDIDFAHAFILNGLTVNFTHFIETNRPAFVHLRIVDETRVDGRIKLMEIEARVFQDGNEVAKIGGSGDISSRTEYEQYRGEAMAAATQASKSQLTSQQSQAPERTIACFDLDGTLTRHHTFWRFLLRCAGKRRFSSTIVKMLPMLPALLRGKTSWMYAREILIDRCLRGMSIEKVELEAQAIADQILQRMLRDGAIDALRWHQEKGHETFIVSNSAEDYLSLLAKRLKINGVFGSRFEVIDGVLTGKLKGTHCQGLEKVKRVRAIIPARDSVKVYAYGDSSGDIALLNWSDYPYLKRF